MSDERQPLRQLSRFERLLVKLRRCPICRGKLIPLFHDQATGWIHTPAGIGNSVNSMTALPFSHMKMGHVTQLNRNKAAYCPGCKQLSIHGWVYRTER